MHRDPASVPGKPVAHHGVVAVGDLGGRARLHIDSPQVPLLVVLLERVDVVLQTLALLLLLRLVVIGHEIDRPAVGRPCDRPHVRGMPRQRTRLPAPDRQQVDLSNLVLPTRGQERDQIATRRPPRAGFAALSPGELSRP